MRLWTDIRTDTPTTHQAGHHHATDTIASYGTWSDYSNHDSVRDTIDAAMGHTGRTRHPRADHAIDSAYRAAIGAMMPDRVQLLGEEFHGPARPTETEFADYPTTATGRLDLAAIIAAVNVRAVVSIVDTMAA